MTVSAENAHQSYFLGLAFSSDGNHLYASFGSITDPTGEKPGNTGNGIAVYSFHQGKVAPERFLKIPPQKIAQGKQVAYGLRKIAAGTAIPYPAGLAVISGNNTGSDKLLVANNLSDNVVLAGFLRWSHLAAVRSQQTSNDSIIVPLHRGRDQGWSPRLVQLVESFQRRRTRLGKWER